jgi:hypothetical protein
MEEANKGKRIVIGKRYKDGRKDDAGYTARSSGFARKRQSLQVTEERRDDGPNIHCGKCFHI